jgi:ferrochelatase
MPIGFATENHETLLDVDHIIHALRRQRSDVTYVQMECVNDHPEFLQMVADWAEPQIEALLSEQAIAVNPSLAHQLAHNHQGGHHHNGHHHDHGHSHGHAHTHAHDGHQHH